MTDQAITDPEILCPFCGAPWSKHAHTQWDDAQSYDTSGRGSPIVCITITCDSCGRVMYEKEDVDRDPTPDAFWGF